MKNNLNHKKAFTYNAKMFPKYFQLNFAREEVRGVTVKMLKVIYTFLQHCANAKNKHLIVLNCIL